MAKKSSISHGDRSGTNMAELRIWISFAVDINKDKSPWYTAIGQGIGVVHSIANTDNFYGLSNRATWKYFRNNGHLTILVECDKRVLNYYGVILANPKKHLNMKVKLGQAFIACLASPERRKTIAA